MRTRSELDEEREKKEMITMIVKIKMKMKAILAKMTNTMTSLTLALSKAKVAINVIRRREGKGAERGRQRVDDSPAAAAMITAIGAVRMVVAVTEKNEEVRAIGMETETEREMDTTIKMCLIIQTQIMAITASDKATFSTSTIIITPISIKGITIRRTGP